MAKAFLAAFHIVLSHLHLYVFVHVLENTIFFFLSSLLSFHFSSCTFTAKRPISARKELVRKSNEAPSHGL